MPDQLLRSLLSGARMPLAASVGVSVLPSSVMSGMFLPDDSALFQSVVRLPHGIHFTTLTWVLAYCGNCLWNCATTPFIQVTWDGTEPPIRQTVSVDGADDVLPDVLLAALPRQTSCWTRLSCSRRWPAPPRRRPRPRRARPISS